MPSIALGGGTKQFNRAIGGSGQYLPDSSTKGTRLQESAGDTTTNGINAQLALVTQASGEGFIVPPNEEFFVYFTGWTNATCVIQKWNPFTAAWETIFTWGTPSPLVMQAFKLRVASAIRIGASAIGADAATLKCNVDFNQSDRPGM